MIRLFSFSADKTSQTMRLLLTTVTIATVMACSVLWLAGSYLVSPATASLGATPAGAIDVSIPSDSGVLLKGWYLPVKDPRGAVALMHGVRSNRAAMLTRARLVNRLGLSALVFDFQAHGETDGEAITFGARESHDARAAVSHLRTAVPNKPLYVIGVSLGGAAALLSNPPLAVQGMILEAVYPDITAAISNRLSMRLAAGSLATPLFTLQLWLRLGIPPERLVPATSAQHLHFPVLLFTGTLDQHTTPQDSTRLYKAFPGPKARVSFNGAAHVDFMAYDSALYAAELSAFIDKTEKLYTAP